MNFITTKDDLLHSVNIVQKAVSNKTTLPILEGILFKVMDNTIYLMGTDLEIGIKTELPGKINSQGSVVISAKLISELVRKLPDDDVFLELNENYILNIKCLNSEFNIQGQNGNEFPQLPEVHSDKEISINKELFKSMIKETIFSVAKNENIPILTGELIEINDGIIKFVALDGYRLALRQGKINDNIELSEVVPERTLSELYRIASLSTLDSVQISHTKNQILFRLGQTHIVSRLLEGEFMNYNQIIPQNSTTKVKVNVAELLSSCERASLMVRDGKSNLIKMNFINNILEIKSNSEMGTVNEQIDVEIEGESIKIAFNSTYFIDVLKIISDEEILLEFTTSVSPCVIKPNQGSNYTYLILPVRYIDH
ncbi:DNA polymerase III subunit beta [Alkalibaculum sp. M08DMB]|uniref:Beta sliding clamp n=1 Tax=Alkalibaculum sporogenes TaxID=2655001 RepID=A0A6A7K7B5_9FIRM|nr:DNA polymerase III subunit beta [Alkalibaculum sporogenes]MPW25324.1 DNA polymerase III subunit beta [Alkalibaculum sporogenes]